MPTTPPDGETQNVITVINYGWIGFGTTSDNDFGEFKLYATPDQYRINTIGEKSKLVPRAGGSYLDVGYGYTGFTLRTYIQNAKDLARINAYAKRSIESDSPIQVIDTIYPAYKREGTLFILEEKVWSGFFELPVLTVGRSFYPESDVLNKLGLPTDVILDEIELTFWSAQEEVL